MRWRIWTHYNGWPYVHILNVNNNIKCEDADLKMRINWSLSHIYLSSSFYVFFIRAKLVIKLLRDQCQPQINVKSKVEMH